jgi:Skp family chaperone for outer membrane proteins
VAWSRYYFFSTVNFSIAKFSSNHTIPPLQAIVASEAENSDLISSLTARYDAESRAAADELSVAQRSIESLTAELEQARSELESAQNQGDDNSAALNQASEAANAASAAAQEAAQRAAELAEELNTVRQQLEEKGFDFILHLCSVFIVLIIDLSLQNQCWINIAQRWKSCHPCPVNLLRASQSCWQSSIVPPPNTPPTLKHGKIVSPRFKMRWTTRSNAIRRSTN